MSKEKLVPKLRFAEFNEDWNKYLLGNISSIGKGFTPSTSNPNYWDGDIDWLSIADMNQGKYITETTKKITDEGCKNKKIIEKDTLIMSFKLTIGRLGILKKDMFTNEAICNFKWKTSDILTEYMYYYLSSINILKYGSQAAKGITLNNDTLSTIPVLLPSIEEQNKIANLFVILDKKVKLLEMKYQKYQDFKKYLMQQIFAQKLRFNFEVVKLKDISKINKGKQLNKEDMLDNGEFYVLNGGQEPSGFTNAWNTPENTITISEGGNSCGFVNFNEEKFWSGGHCYYLSDLSTKIDNYYLFSYLKFIEPRIMRLRVGSGLPNIQKGDIENIKVKITKLDEQNKIRDILKATDKYIYSINAQKQNFKIFKKGLLQQMFI